MLPLQLGTVRVQQQLTIEIRSRSSVQVESPCDPSASEVLLQNKSGWETTILVYIISK